MAQRASGGRVQRPGRGGASEESPRGSARHRGRLALGSRRLGGGPVLWRFRHQEHAARRRTHDLFHKRPMRVIPVQLKVVVKLDSWTRCAFRHNVCSV